MQPPARDIIFSGSGGIQKTQIMMDDIENIEAQVSYLQEDIGQRLPTTQPWPEYSAV